MTAVKPVLDTYLELNLIMALSVLIWFAARLVLERTSLRVAYFAQLRVMKGLLLCIALSPVLAIGVFALTDLVFPGQPVAIGDIAVAAFLRGEIALPAAQFEILLNTRERWIEMALAGRSLGTSVLLFCLLAVSACLVLRVVRAGLRIRETINASFLWRQSAKVDVRLSDRIAVPFAVRGLRRRHVVLPSHLIDKPNELRFAIAHEFQHVRAGDVEWELVLEFLRPVFFWNPAFLILKNQFERLRELGCDQSIMARRRLNAKEYANCLLDYCARTMTREKPYVLDVALVGGSRAKRVLRQRVLALAAAPVAHSQLPLFVIGTSVIFAVLLSVGSASMRQTDDWSHDRIMLSTVVNLERLAERNQRN